MWSEVLVSGASYVRVGVLLGDVRRSAKGAYQYYRGPLNQLMYEFEDEDLDRIKKRVR
jgi:hypothetical protein